MPGKFGIWTLTLAVASSLLAGFAISTFAYRYGVLRPPGEAIIARMSRELDLSDTQREQISDIMQETRFKAKQLHHEFQHQKRRLFVEAFDRIRGTLTPDQQARFDRSFQSRRMRRERGEEPQSAPPPRDAPQDDGL